MPLKTTILWLVTMFSGYIWGFYILWKIEKTGVKRWGGGTGSIFRNE